MPRQRRFYDPFIQQPEPSHVTPEPEPIMGVRVSRPGVYLHIDDVVATLRSMGLEDAALSFEQHRLV